VTEAGERFRCVDRAFLAAIAAAPGDRDGLIARACGGDASLEAEVRALLDADATEGPIPLDTDAPAPPPQVERVGAYALKEVIGRGGMGVVYRAERASPRRVVALKLIRRGLQGDAALRRFRLEAEALSRLQHPCIAAIYEVGLDAGDEQPYFAMELVEGEPITAHADRAGLFPRDRLALIARVCDAIDHAHTRGVVHRDLKPENVHVTKDGDPKVLDLGVAKLLELDPGSVTAATMDGQVVGTIHYMAPEQISGSSDAIDPRTDVYALGVLAFELLTGELPFRTTGVSLYEAMQRIRTEPIPAMARVRPGLDPDIATIVEKAMSKEPDARYPSAAALASDIRRFLADEPILARPASTLYQLCKFAKRNRMLVGSVAAIVVVLTVSLVAVTLALRSARSAHRWAMAEREVTEAVNAFLLDDLIAAADPRRGGAREVTLLEALNAASDSLGDRFTDAPASEAAIRAALGEVYSTLNDFPRATANTRRALELTPEQETGLRIDRLNALALLHMDLGQNDEATAAIEQAERLLASAGPDDTLRRLETRSNAGRLAYKIGDRERALELYASVAETGEREFADNAVTITAVGAVSLILQQLGRPEEALPMSERVIRLDEMRNGPDHPDTLTTLNNHAMLLTRLDRFEEAETIYRRILESRLSTLGGDNVDTNVTRFVYAGMLLEVGRPEEAASLARLACDRLTRVLGADHRYTQRACDTASRAEAALDSNP
jgi:tetratricopeptide (TPR) repeat protein